MSNNVLDDYINGAPLQPGSVTCGSHRAATCSECSAILGCFGECAASAAGVCELDATNAYRIANPLYAEGNYYYGDPKYEKHHMRFHGSQAEADASDAGFGRIKIEPGHAAFIERPVSYACNLMGDWNLPADRKSCPVPISTQWLYPAVLREEDDRTAYHSAKYPWILSVTAERIKGDEGGGPDTTLIKIPASHGPGGYLLNYHWGGYNDCIDVAVFPPAADGVTPGIPDDDWARYGYKSSETALYKIDHCQFVSRSLEVIEANEHAVPGLANGVCADPSVCGAGAISCTAIDQVSLFLSTVTFLCESCSPFGSISLTFLTATAASPHVLRHTSAGRAELSEPNARRSAGIVQSALLGLRLWLVRIFEQSIPLRCVRRDQRGARNRAAADDAERRICERGDR